MAKIRVLESVSGDGFAWSPGEVVELPAAEAAKWADGYRAEYVKGEKPERAVPPKPETPESPATKPTPAAKPAPASKPAAKKAVAKRPAAKKAAASKPTG